VDTESALVVIAYPSDSVAQGAIATLERLSIERLIDLEDTAYAVKGWDGRVSFHETSPSAHAGVKARLAHPFGSAKVRDSKLESKYSRLGIDDAYMAELASTLEAGGCAVILLVRSSARQRVLEEMGKFGGTVIKSTLPPEIHEELKAALSGTKPGTEGS
jgi:uncharacterized membrane protein